MAIKILVRLMPVLVVFWHWWLGGLLAGLNCWDGLLRGLGFLALDVWLQNLKSSGDVTISCLGDWERAIRLAAASDALSSLQLLQPPWMHLPTAPARCGCSTAVAAV